MSDSSKTSVGVNVSDRALFATSRIHDAENVSDVRSILLEAVQGLGFRFVRCGDHVDPICPPAGNVVLHNFPVAWVEKFSVSKRAHFDPALQHAEEVIAPFHWSEIKFLRGLSDRRLVTLNDARRNGIAEGYTIPLSHMGCVRASCSLIPDREDIAPQSYAVANSIVTISYVRAGLIEQRGRGEGKIVKLSPRERECLALSAMGFSVAEIAEQFGTKQSTIRQHFGRARKRLCARSREHAVALALKQRHIV